jgi:uncharacterized membrane protein YpjA
MIMKSVKKNILYGLLVWIITFLISFAFYSQNGELTIDKIFFKTIMIIVGTLVGVFLIVKYFRTVESNFLKEGILLGISWLLINWALDFIILIPMAEMATSNYFTEIGLRYLNFPIISIAFAYSLNQKPVEK